MSESEFKHGDCVGTDLGQLQRETTASAARKAPILVARLEHHQKHLTSLDQKPAPSPCVCLCFLRPFLLGGNGKPTVLGGCQVLLAFRLSRTSKQPPNPRLRFPLAQAGAPSPKLNMSEAPSQDINHVRQPFPAPKAPRKTDQRLIPNLEHASLHARARTSVLQLNLAASAGGQIPLLPTTDGDREVCQKDNNLPEPVSGVAETSLDPYLRCCARVSPIEPQPAGACSLGHCKNGGEMGQLVSSKDTKSDKPSGPETGSPHPPLTALRIR